MASNVSFDVVSEFDRQELVNAIDQVRREVATRFDFKGAKVSVELSDKEIGSWGKEFRQIFSAR